MRKWIAWLLLLVCLLQGFALAETLSLQTPASQIDFTNRRSAVRTAAEVYFVLSQEDGDMLLRVPLDGSDAICVDSADSISDLVAFNYGVAYLKTELGMTTIENCLGNSVTTVYSFGAGAADALSVYDGKLLVLMGGLLHSIEPDTGLCLKLSGAEMLEYVVDANYAYYIASGDQIEYTAQISETNAATQAGCLYRLNLASGETELMLKSGIEDLDILDYSLYFHNLSDAYGVVTAENATLCGRVYSLDAQMMTLESECKQPDSGFWPLSDGLVAWYDGALNMDTAAGTLALYSPENGSSVFSDGEMLYIWEPAKQTLTEARTNGALTTLYTGDLTQAGPVPTATIAPEATIEALDLGDGNSDWLDSFLSNASNADGNSYTSSANVSTQATPIPQATATPTPAPTATASSSGSSSSSSSSSGSSSSSSSSSTSSGKYVKAVGGSVYIRSSASTSAKALGVLPEGATGTNLGKTSTDSRGVKWYKVKYNGITGWVSSKYSKIVSTASSASSSSSGSSSSGSGNYVKAVGGNVYIRSSASKSATALGTLPEGVTGTYLGKTSTDSRGVKWYKIQYNGVTGWVSSKYSKIVSTASSSSSSSSSSGNYVQITGGDAFIRSEPNKSSTQLGAIKNGSKATYLGSSSTDSRGVKWYRIQYNGITGWVSSKYSKIV